MHQQRESISSFFYAKNVLWATIFSYWNGIIAIDKEIHEKHHDIYCDLPNTFPLDDFAFKSLS